MPDHPRVYNHAYRRPGHPGQTRGASRLLRWLGRNVGWLFYRVRVLNLENLPQDGPTLVLVKHQRNEDIPLGFGYVLTERRDDNWCLMKHDLVSPWLFGFFPRAGGIPINRDQPMRSRPWLRMVREVLHNGHLVVLFPEQTFFEQHMGPGKFPGFRWMTKQAPAAIQVVPVGFTYTPAKRKWFARETATLNVGEVRMMRGDLSEAEQARFLHECMHEVARLSDMEYPHAMYARKRAVRK